jgi:hypothetical protein
VQRRPLLVVLAVLAASQLGWRCPWPVHLRILSPGTHVDQFSFELSFELTGNVEPGSLRVEINGESVLDRLSGGPVFTGTIDPGAPLRDFNMLVVRAREAHTRHPVLAVRPFRYKPPGKARARRIRRRKDLIHGPLAHSRIGDWLLENGEARFVVQDVGQRDLYSVGQYGGNVIDAEVVGRPGLDNFLELQPGLNVETVINAQRVEVVNDGEDGTAAIVRTCGPDDLLDFVNPSSQVADVGIPGISFPAFADDNDLEIEACTEYALEPGKSYLRIDTEVFNDYPQGGVPPDIPDPLPLVVGDWLNPAGELHTVERPNAPPGLVSPAANGVGPPVASSLGTLGFFGFDEAAGVDYSFSQVPLEGSDAGGSSVFISGVLVVLHNQNALLTLIGADPILFEVPAGGSRTYTRFFGVGDGSASHAFDLENEIQGVATGTLEGCVSVAGSPVAGARVSVGNPLGSGKAASNAKSDKLFSHFTTRPGPCPNYSGSIRVGSYKAAAALDGHLYEGGGSVPPFTDVTISAGTTTTADFDLPASGRLRVQVSDAAGRGMPARVTVVGFDPSPEPTTPGPSLPGFGGDTSGLFNDVNDSLRFGIAAVGYADASGFTEFDLEPGVDRYHVYVSRGTEFSAFRTASPITVTAGNTSVVNAQLARVVDTTGFVSSDFHVHGIRSADSRVSDTHRVESYSAEGVENVIMTDHHRHTDLRPRIADLGMQDFVTATIGEEITTFDYGHFNAYPLLIDADSPHATFADDGTPTGGGSTDWAQAAPPGRDFPSYGALNATPEEIHNLATLGALSRPGVTTVQINHIDSHFAPLKIDTSLMPPRDLMSDADRAGRRLPDTTTVPNLFFPFPALELWNGSSRGDQREFLDERIGIWMNHLNQGYHTTFIADTDSHRFANLNTAGARTWTASPTDDPAAIDPAGVAHSVVAGRAVGGQGVFVTTRLLSTDGSGDVAELSWDGDTTMTDATGNVVLEIHIQSPAWAEWDTVEVYANAATTPLDPAAPYLYDAIPSLVLHEGDCEPSTTDDDDFGDFDVQVTEDIDGVAGADRWSATLSVPFGPLLEPTWFVVVVKGSDGACHPMFPMYPDDLAQADNENVEDLTDGNLGESGVMALGATNALYFEP